jgi:hypothetical protein
MRDLSKLPDIPSLRRLTRALAMLDAILSPEWEYRHYSFDAHWAEGETMASMRNGSGDEWFALFCPAGAVLKGLAHESAFFQPNFPISEFSRHCRTNSGRTFCTSRPSIPPTPASASGGSPRRPAGRAGR